MTTIACLRAVILEQPSLLKCTTWSISPAKSWCKCTSFVATLYYDKILASKLLVYFIMYTGGTCRTGPLVNTWAMRMEAKNSYFKRIARSSNFKNVPYTVARRHQRLQCANLQCSTFFDRELACGPGKPRRSHAWFIVLTVVLSSVWLANEPKELHLEDQVIVTKVNERGGEFDLLPTDLVHR